MATINNDFKVKNGLVVGTTATVLSTVQSTSSTTGALLVSGGIGVAKDIQVGGTFISQGYDLMSYDGSVHYVSDGIGSDSNDGHRLISSFKTIKHALTQAQSGDKVYIEAGTYYEEFPLTIPQGVSVRGAGLRAVTVYPTTATNTQTAFLLNGESYISDFTVTGFYKPGSAFAFAPNAKITTRSPYIERFSVITRGSATSSGDPYGFNAGDAGNGAYLDAGILDPTSLEPAMLWNEATFIVPNATGFYMTNGARAELLNGFTYFADKSIFAEAGTVGYGGVGKTKLKLSGVSGTFTAGDTIIYKDPSGTTLASGTIQSVDGSYVYLNGPVWGFELATDRPTKTVTPYGNAVQSNLAYKYGITSAKFDGSGDYLEVLNDADFQFGTGDYTVEAWVNVTTINKLNRIFYKGTVNGSSIRFNITAGNVLAASHGGTAAIGTTVISPGIWYHVAVSHSSAGDLKVFLNGSLEATTTGTTANIDNTDPVSIGGISAAAAESLDGYIDDLRVSNNYRYSTTFSTPTTQLGSDANTVLLLTMNGGNTSNVFVDSNIASQNVYSTGSSPATATRIELADYHQFGAELRCIGSAAVFGNSGITANGTGTDLKLIAFNLSHIGSGKDLSCDASLTVQSNEIIQTNGGIIYYQTVDHNGDFRVGDSFLVNQRTGNVSFGNAQVNLSNLNSLVITDGIHSTTILPTGVSSGNINLSGNTIATLSGDLTLNPAGVTTIINSDLEVNGHTRIYGTEASTSTMTGALTVGGGVGIGGNLYVGGTMYGAFSGALQGTATTATNIYAGSAGQIPYQAGFSQTSFTGPGNAGEVFVSYGTNMPRFQNTLTLSSSLVNTGTSTSSNALYVVGGIGAGWINLANEGWINGAQIVTTATLGSSFGTGGVSNPINITNTGSNAFTVIGGAVIGGNLLIGGNVQFNGTVTTIDSTSVDIGSKVVYLSTLSNTALQAFGSGFIIGTNPETSTVTNTWASLTFDGGTPGNWIMGNGLWPGSNNLYNLGDSTFKWATAYINTVTASVINGTSIYDNGNRVLTSESPTGGVGIGITDLVSGGPAASFTINNLGVTSATGSTYIGVSASTGSITITNLGVQSLIGSTYIQVSDSTGTVTLTNTGVTNLSSGSDITLSATTGSITINDVSTLQSVTNRGATSNNAITITNATVSTGTSSGALTVTGGVGIQGSVYAGNIYSNGNQVLTSGAGGGGYVSSVSAGTDISVNTTTGAVTVSDISTLQSVTGRGAISNNAITITNTTVSTGTNSGAMIVYGGVGIGGNVYIGGSAFVYDSQVLTTGTVGTYSVSALSAGTDTRVSSSVGNVTVWNESTLQSVSSRGATTNAALSITNSTASTGTNNGALTVSGGLGVLGAIYGGTVYSNGSQVVTQGTLGNLSVTSLTAGTDTAVSTSTGAVTIWATSTLQSVTSRGSTTDNLVSISNTTVSTSTNSGALQVVGGVGIGGSIYAANMYSNSSPVVTQETLGGLSVTSIAAGTGIQVNTSTGAVIVTNIGTTATLGSTYIGVSANTGVVTITNLGVQTITAGTDTRVSSSTGTVTIWDESTLQTVTGRGATSNAAISLTNTLSVTGQTTLGAVTATSMVVNGTVTATNIVVNGTVQHNGIVLTNGLNIDQVYSTSTTITLSTNWQDTDVDAAELATGSYMVQCTANDSGVGGNEVNTYYTGIMSWYSNGNTENSYDEITLHRAGAVSGSGAIFLQVLRTNGGFTKLQIAGTTNNSGPSTYALKFRRMI